MNNLNLSIKDLSSLMGTYEKKAIRWARKNAHVNEVEGVGRGGRQLMVALESLPEDLQKKYFELRAPAKIITIPEDRLPKVRTETLPTTSNSKIKLTPSQERVALARTDLVNAVVSQKASAAGYGQDKTSTAQTMLDLYNSGMLLPGVRETLGSVTLQTVYRWERALKLANADFKALAPQYGHNRGEFSLSEMERDAFLSILLHPNRYRIGTAIKHAKLWLSMRGYKSHASVATFRRFAERYREDNYHIWVLAREGEKALDDKVLPYIERDSSLLSVGDILVADGHPLNFQVINPWTGKPARATLVMFIDWASRYPVGYEIMMTEDVQCIHSAFRRSVLTLGKAPRHALIDNGKAFKARVFTSDIDLGECGLYGLYGRLGVKVRLAAPYNAKDKPIERFFRTFSDLVERAMPSYCGASIGDKPAYMSRNEKFHKSLHNPVVPTIEQAMELVQRGIEMYSREAHSGLNGRTPIEVFEEGKGPGVDKDELNYLMMTQELRSVHRNGVRVLGGNYWDDFLVGIKGRVVIRYDLQDVTRIHIYGLDGDFLGVAHRTHRFDPLMRGKDAAAMKEFMKKKRELKSNTMRVVRGVMGKTEKLKEIPWDDVIAAVPEMPEAIEVVRAEAEPDALVMYEYGYERYEALAARAELTDEERAWMRDYEDGAICPGEYRAVFGQKAVAVEIQGGM